MDFEVLKVKTHKIPSPSGRFMVEGLLFLLTVDNNKPFFVAFKVNKKRNIFVNYITHVFEDECPLCHNVRGPCRYFRNEQRRKELLEQLLYNEDIQLKMLVRGLL
ncbi:hypothetical protein [Neobacillus drentensis]|uniref:hypothetical protein n=1 Tax=Neobacillus drentensis TaxID=220684 RepID=UPI0028652848|nr:hypothetical protein [Neobacillus drentensis]MDR7237307.1 hypothetical protein [Neobacillus drentensis]